MTGRWRTKKAVRRSPGDQGSRSAAHVVSVFRPRQAAQPGQVLLRRVERRLLDREFGPFPPVLEAEHHVAGLDHLPLAHPYLGHHPRHLGTQLDALRPRLHDPRSRHGAGEPAMDRLERRGGFGNDLPRGGQMPEERGKRHHRQPGEEERADNGAMPLADGETTS